MKRIFSAILFCSLVLCAYGQTVMNIAGEDISKQEFEYYYNKNSNKDSVKMSIDEYSERFINFKLKVAEALSRKMDTVSSFKKELAGYREQLTQPYLINQEKIDELVNEEYARLGEDVNVSHILIRIEQGKDTTEAYAKAQEALKRLKKEKFEVVAAEMSEDPSMIDNGGNIGWITGLSTVYPFETAAYNTPVGKTSGIIRTVFGYHILKVNARRQSRGKVKVAHIFFRKKENFNQKQLDSLSRVVNGVYDQLAAGKISFAEAARKYSEDGTAQSGGEMPWISTGRTNELFEDAAFALSKPEEISKPVEAPYGWHIIQLIEKKPIDSLDDMRSQIESRIKGDERIEIIYRSFIDKLKKKYDFKMASAKEKDVIARFANVTLTKDSLQKFIDNNANIGADTLDSFICTTLYDYENRNLENEYPEFGLLMKEYHDGILMFNISQVEIWGKAAKDTTGLKKYFEANKDKYKWDTPHYKGIIVHCVSKDAKKRAQKMLSTVSFEDAYQCLLNLNVNGNKYYKLERGVYPEGKNIYIDHFVFKKGKLPENKKYPESLVTGRMLGTTPESYTEVKGPLLNDYQAEIENRWVASLREKYPVKIYPEVLGTVK